MTLLTIEQLSQRVKTCFDCPLSQSRTQAVPGWGNSNSPLVIIGEAPGAQEDATGLPFVGASGKMVDKILAEFNVSRADLFITNIVDCRPPANRNPKDKEVKACKKHWQTYLHIIEPKVIVTFGNIATKTVLDTKTGITSLRGSSHSSTFGDSLVVPTWHPAAILRARKERYPQAVEDIELALKLAKLI